MSETLTNVGNWLGSTAGKTVLGAGTGIGGLIQNLIAYRKQQDIQNTLTNPAKLNAMVAKEVQPLSQGLTTDIARSADAYGAERGLGSSPYIMKDVYAQALAPSLLAQQQKALEAVLSQLGMAQRGAMQPVNVASIFKALQMTNPAAKPFPTGVWGGGSVGGVPDPALGTVGAMPGYVPPAPSYMNLPSVLPTSTVDYNTGDFGNLFPNFGGGSDVSAG